MKPFQFTDRADAGRVLSDALQEYVGKPNLIVLALPRGGVPVAFEVAQSLGAPLDIILVRKLGVPGNEELAMGAIAEDGLTIVDQDMVRRLGITEEAVRLTVMREQFELERRERLYRDGRSTRDVHGKTAIIVDDGLATGSSMYAAIQALRKRNVASLVVAVPVGTADAIKQLAKIADKVVCAVIPPSLGGVGRWYAHFGQIGDDEVHALLRQAIRNEEYA